jgi:asparaginyl-tRNA synthetase
MYWPSEMYIHLVLLFRAENSNTARHAAEFWMIEPEIAFARSIEDNMELAEDLMVKYIINYVMEECTRRNGSFLINLLIKLYLERLNNV